MRTPAHITLAVFDQKWHDPMPHPPYSPDLTSSDFFVFPLGKKSPQGETFLPMWMEEVTKSGRSTKKVPKL